MPNFLSHTRFQKNSSVFLLFFCALVISYLFWGLMLPRKDFYNELWGPTYLLVHGYSPYNTLPLDANLPAAWLPMAIGMFFPLGWLPEEIATVVWYFLCIYSICHIIYLIQQKLINLYNTVALVFICFFSPFTLNHINLGQFSIIATLAWVLSVYFFERNCRWISIFFIALALTKPQLGFLAILGLSSYIQRERGIYQMLLFWVQILVACLIMCLPLFIAYPKWIPDAITSMLSNPPWVYPSLYSLFTRWFGTLGYVVWGLLALFILFINFRVWKKIPIENSLYWSLALGLLVTPYLGSWDFVAIFPLLILTYINISWQRKFFLWLVYILMWFGMFRIQMLEESHNYFFWWVPVLLIGSMAILTTWKDIYE